MNDFLKDLIKSVDELEEMSLTEVLDRLDDIERKYNEHIIKKKLEDNRLLRKELTAVQDELRRLKEEYGLVNKLKWEQSFMVGNEIFISKNTFLNCMIRKNDIIGYELKVIDTRDSHPYTWNCVTLAKCKEKAEEIYKQSVNQNVN